MPAHLPLANLLHENPSKKKWKAAKVTYLNNTFHHVTCQALLVGYMQNPKINSKALWGYRGLLLIEFGQDKPKQSEAKPFVFGFRGSNIEIPTTCCGFLIYWRHLQNNDDRHFLIGRLKKNTTDQNIAVCQNILATKIFQQKTKKTMKKTQAHMFTFLKLPANLPKIFCLCETLWNWVALGSPNSLMHPQRQRSNAPPRVFLNRRLRHGCLHDGRIMRHQRGQTAKTNGAEQNPQLIPLMRKVGGNLAKHIHCIDDISHIFMYIDYNWSKKKLKAQQRPICFFAKGVEGKAPLQFQGFSWCPCHGDWKISEKQFEGEITWGIQIYYIYMLFDTGIFCPPSKDSKNAKVKRERKRKGFCLRWKYFSTGHGHFNQFGFLHTCPKLP